MQGQKQKALIVKEFKKPPVYGDFDIIQPGPNQVQIKMIASTINPSDRITLEGGYWNTQANFIGGLQGCGTVVKAGGPQGEHLVGKRVSFGTYGYGTWAEYSVADVKACWVVDEDVPLQSAASGFVNPLTVLGIVDTFKKWKNRGSSAKGLIHTAAASALGRMLNKICQSENIPLLNIVRRQEQVKILQEEGAKYIINTSDENWLDQYKEAIKTHGFNLLFDAIGGGQVTDKLISNLPPLGVAHIYGKLCRDPFVISKPLIFSGGVCVTSFLLNEWMPSLTQEEVAQMRKNFSTLLKNELATHSIKQIKLADVVDELKDSQARATEGKYTIIM